jgi:hypothetical protein
LALTAVAVAEKSDVAALFGAARVSGTPGVAVGEMNDMCHVFGKTQTEGELLFRVSNCMHGILT